MMWQERRRACIILADAGADTSSRSAARWEDKPGSHPFLAPIKGRAEEAARQADFKLRSDVVGVQVQGPSRVGEIFG